MKHQSEFDRILIDSILTAVKIDLGRSFAVDICFICGQFLPYFFFSPRSPVTSIPALHTKIDLLHHRFEA
ncbi:hypothetical protein L1987_11460 [Smallanthus sonchifolius]|uniref:Uncharacterized protein n=1 Tax=Smallanthus sonchifolius TaxID=185202 RepID=A0ACB9JBI9_9ASTR|nr:hypothetical protein L1987_11460 [Smallanthus sonchifolius]